MAPQPILSKPANLRLYTPGPRNTNFGPPEKPATPNDWYAQRYPNEAATFGSPFLELTDLLTHEVIPVSLNIDFFAAVLGGRRDLGHHIIYFEPEMQWYFKDSDGIYKPTTAEKLATLYRALMMKCAQEVPGNVNKLNLFHEFRSDKVAKAIVQRAKSVLAANDSFFAADSPHRRIKGPELIERVARVFVEDLLAKEPGQILRLHDAYATFLAMLKDRNLPGVKRSEFKAVVGPMIRQEFDVALRNDLGAGDGMGIRGWKGLRMVQTVPT